MKKSRYTEEQIAFALRQAETELEAGTKLSQCFIQPTRVKTGVGQRHVTVCVPAHSAL